MSEPIVVIDRYEMIEELAVGGMATVYLGRVRGAVGFARAIAMKRLHKQFAHDREFVAMFLDEARLASRIRHPNVVPTLDVVASGGEIFLVMEYVHGESLSSVRRQLVDTGVTIPIPIAVAIMTDVLAGLHAAHEVADEHGQPLEVVHRDVSPQNILIGVDGISRVLDFGVSKAAGRLQSTSEGQVKGKTAYMAPEQLTTGNVDRRCDVYAASVVLWEILAGRRLFAGDSHQQIMTKILTHDVLPLRSVAPHVSAELEEIVMSGLDPSPDRRFPTAREMGRALARAATPATPFDVAEWLEATMHVALEERTALLARVEQGRGADGQAAYARKTPQEAGGSTELTATAPTQTTTPSHRGRIGLIAILLLAAVGALVFIGLHRSSEAGDGRVAAPAAPPAPSAPTSAAAIEPLTASATTLPSASPHPAHVVPSAAGGGTNKPRSTKPGCNPPYTVDAEGHRHFLVECL